MKHNCSYKSSFFFSTQKKGDSFGNTKTSLVSQARATPSRHGVVAAPRSSQCLRSERRWTSWMTGCDTCLLNKTKWELALSCLLCGTYWKTKGRCDTPPASELCRRQDQTGVSFVNREKCFWKSLNSRNPVNSNSALRSLIVFYHHDTCLPRCMESELVLFGRVEAEDGKTEFKNVFFVKN